MDWIKWIYRIIVMVLLINIMGSQGNYSRDLVSVLDLFQRLCNVMEEHVKRDRIKHMELKPKTTEEKK